MEFWSVDTLLLLAFELPRVRENKVVSPAFAMTGWRMGKQALTIPRNGSRALQIPSLMRLKVKSVKSRSAMDLMRNAEIIQILSDISLVF